MRRMLWGTVAVVLVASVVVVSPAGRPQSQAQVIPTPPNVVIILSDDQRADTLDAPIPGTSIDPMPRLNDILRGGSAIKFSHGYVPSAVCCPSRASLLTGAYPHTTHVYRNQWSAKCRFKWSTSYRPCGGNAFDDAHTLATWLDDAGYETSLMGKYLNGYQGTEQPRGWDQGHVIIQRPIGVTVPINPYTFVQVKEWTSGGSVDPDPIYCTEMLDSPVLDGRTCDSYPGVGTGDQFFATDLFRQFAVDFINGQEADDDRPFFLFAGFVAPHSSILTPHREDRVQPDPPSYVGLYEGDDALPRAFGSAPLLPSFNESNIRDKAYWMDSQAENRKLGATPEKPRPSDLEVQRADVYRSLRSLDDAVGAIFDALAANGELDNTIVVFLGDNGFMWGEHRLIRKSLPFEESIRVPFVIYYPAVSGRVEDGPEAVDACSYGRVGGTGTCHIEDEPVSSIDLAPTILDLAGFPDPNNPEGCTQQCGYKPEGVSLVPLLTKDLDGDDPDVPRLAVFFENGAYDLIENNHSRTPPPFCGIRTSVDHPPVGIDQTDVSNYAYVRYAAHKDDPPVKRRDLYRMNADPYQLRSVAARRAFGQARSWLSRQLYRGPSAFCSPPPPLRGTVPSDPNV